MPISSNDIKALTSKTEALNLLNRNGIATYTSVTLFESLTNSFQTNYTSYLKEVTNRTGTKAKDAVVAEMIKDVVGKCNPIAAQLFFISNLFLKDALNCFSTDKDADILATTIDDYKNQYVEPKQEWLTAYRLSYTKFRTMMKDKNYEGPECLFMTSAVKAELKVGTATADIISMLEKMKKQRGSLLGNITSGCDHLAEAVIVLQSDFTSPLIAPWKRGILTERAEIGGCYQLDNATGKWEVFEAGRMLLLSSALCAMNQNPIALHKLLIDKVKLFVESNKDSTNPTIKANWKVLARAKEEAQHLFNGDTVLPGAGGNGKYSAQMMNIDPLWFTFFVVTKIAKIDNLDDFYRFQRGIYGACEDYRGRNNMDSMFNAFSVTGLPGFGKLRTANSSAKNIHLPPWIYTYARTFDMAACIAPCDIGNPEPTIRRPAISWRYFLCLDFSKKKEAISFITSLWNVEGLANVEEPEDIRISERILHQVIMGRNSPLANTNQITGNALNVRIVE